MRRSAAPRWAAGLLLGFLAAACSPVSDDGARALAELERLAFVPAGQAPFLARHGRATVCTSSADLLVDRFEVPRAEWRRFQATFPEPADPELTARTAGWAEDTDYWPATWITRDEARAYARSRGMRLPSAQEWLRIAAGTRAQPYPWGPGRASRVANTAELELGRPVAVGTFELGQTPFSAYDMSGNVWEWVDDPLPQATGRDLESSPLAWVLGGSYASPLARLWDLDNEGRVDFQHLDLHPLTRAEDIGCRCVVEASTWLKLHALEWSDEALRTRVVGVGRMWGRDAVPLLEELARPDDAPLSLRWLLEGARR
jgi:hypothetical protein